MKPYSFSEKTLIVLLFIVITIGIFFAYVGFRNWKKHDCFERVSFLAAIVALFLSQITSVFSNYNIMEHVKANIKTAGMIFDETTEPSSDYIDENMSTEITEEQNPSDSGEKTQLEKIVYDNPNIIFKDEIFQVDIRVRNVTKDENVPVESREYLSYVYAEIGDVIEYQIHYKNTTWHHSENVIVAASLPTNCEYVENSTVLFNSTNPNGIRNDDNTISKSGINIGGYDINGDAYIRFRVVIIDKSLSTGQNRLVTWTSITNGVYESDGVNEEYKWGETLNDSADVYVKKN